STAPATSTNSRPGWRRATAISARPRSTRARTRSSATSFPRRFWGYELRLQRRTAAARRLGAALHPQGLRLRIAQEDRRLDRGMEREDMGRLRRDGAAWTAALAGLRRVRRRRRRHYQHHGIVRGGA